MSKSRPQFALFAVKCWTEWDCGYPSRVSQASVVGYFASYQGAQFAYHKAGGHEYDDESLYLEIRSLQPGTVYDQRKGWMPGLEWKAYWPQMVAAAQPQYAWEEIPF